MSSRPWAGFSYIACYVILFITVKYRGLYILMSHGPPFTNICYAYVCMKRMYFSTVFLSNVLPMHNYSVLYHSRRPPPPFRIPKTNKKTTIFWPKYRLECVIWGFGFQNYPGEYAPDPSRARECHLWFIYIFLQKSAPPVCQFLDPPLVSSGLLQYNTRGAHSA